MSKAISNALGKRMTVGWRRRQKEGIAARQARGLPIGGHNKGPTFESVCSYPACKRIFEWRPERKIGKPYWDRKFCSQSCAAKDLDSKHRKLPDAETLRRLYVDEARTCLEIAQMYGLHDHSSVKDALKKAGIPRRRTGPYNSGVCVEAHCEKPVHKVLSSNGSLYGRRCLEHQKQFKKESNAKAFRKWWMKKKQLHASKTNNA